MKKLNDISNELRSFVKSKDFKAIGVGGGAISSAAVYAFNTFQSLYAGYGYSEFGDATQYSISFYNKLPPSHFGPEHIAMYLMPFAIAIGLSYLFHKLSPNPKTSANTES